MNRAYSILEIKSVDDGERMIEGIASTPAPDRMDDIVEPMGAKFQLPMPLLWQHNHDQPVGQVEFAKPTKDGIPFRARIARVDEPGVLKDRLDEAWQSVKTKLVRAVSIGFRSLEHSVMENGGWRFISWEWLELSLVTIPANREATITTIRSIDADLRAATGQQEEGDERDRPGASGTTATATPAVAQTKAPKEGRKMKTIAEQITAFEASRASKSARMQEIQQKAAEEGRTKDEAEREEFDTLTEELKAIERELADLQTLEKAGVKSATAVAGATDTKTGSELRGGSVQVKGPDLPKGTAFTRYAIALARSKGNLMQAAEIAKEWHETTPEVGLVLKAAVAAGTTTDANWAAPLVPYTQMASEFIELLRPATIIGRIPGLRRVPFNISMPKQTSGSSVGWVGEGKPKPVSKLQFGTETLRWAKAAGIVVLTDELVRFSNPSAEAVVRQDLIATMAQFHDEQFLDPTVAEVSNVSPASVTNGVTPIAASGTDADALREDLADAMAALITATNGIGGTVIIMSEIRAMRIASMRNALGQKEFPELSATGGFLEGLPVITSEAAPTNLIDSASPPTYAAGDMITLVRAPEVYLADDGQVVLDASREASVEMDSVPDNPADASTVLVSLWQHNMVGLRAERWINWKKRRSGAVQYIAGADYGAAA